MRIAIPNSSKLDEHTEEEPLEDIVGSDEELENDFEETPRIPDSVPTELASLGKVVPETADLAPFDAMRERAGSMATIRLHRRARLAEKLKEVYELEDIREVWAGVSTFSFTLLRVLTRYLCRNALLAPAFSL